jgi:hypothetical protein
MNSNLVEVQYNLVLSKEKGWHHRSVLGEMTWTKDGRLKNLTRTRNVPPKCNKQVTTRQQTRFSLTSINYSSKTTVALGTAMTILEIGISFPTKDKLSKVCRFTMATMCCDSCSYIANMLAFLLCLLVNNRRSATHQACPCWKHGTKWGGSHHQ